ncbi:MAG: efflux RND transporter periplasmic adaptor subunit [Thermomonas sp.]|nr:efflux RND transporter periplasmic adaptor subunit [Thermomonas sp.]HQY82311.1 efflux RND transporter periplasmic adaptor subunit [Thermomonas sp.]
MSIVHFFAARRLPAWLLAAFLLAALSACTGASPGPEAATAAAPGSATAPAKATTTVYSCPMHPHIQQHGPGQCPICGMDLQKREVAAGVAVSAAVVQSLGIRTATPVLRDVRPRVRVPARVVADARGQARLQARVDGWIERLLVRAVGQPVAAGSVVAEIYAPELVQAQEELLLGPDTAGPARERLRRLGIADADIERVRRSGSSMRRLPLRAPVAGVVTELGVREGSRVTPETLVVDIAGRNAVWIEAQLFPAQRRLLGRTFAARFTLPGSPGEAWSSASGSLVPVADAITQTLAVRFAVGDAADLPLGTVLDAEIDGDTRTGVLLVPASAVIRTSLGDRVLVERAPRRFVPTEVTLGQRYGEEVEIRDGLAATDRIVVSGQFLLDAEASLQAGLAQMQDAAAGASP